MDAPSGTVIWSKTWDIGPGEAFRFHAGVVQLILRSLVREARQKVELAATIDRPVTPEGYELYLRANQLSFQGTPENNALARDLYVSCLEKDPNYAPAWARLARCYRYLEKFGTETARHTHLAQEAFQRAFALNPDLGLAHNLYTPLQTDLGQAECAMVRLLRRATSHENDPELFTGLVHASRYCGQLKASIAAHERVLRLDRTARTGVAHTYFLMGDYEKTLYWYGTGFGLYLDALALACMGRLEEASALLWTRRDRFHLLGESNELALGLPGGQTRRGHCGVAPASASQFV